MRQSLFTIAPDAPFLDTLVSRILDGTLIEGWVRSGPFWLTDVTILLPTRRARMVLAEAFMQRGQSLLPDIRTLGGEDEEEEPFLPPIDAPLLLPAVSGLERRLVLGRLIAAWARRTDGFASPPNAAEVLWLADSLASLVDDLAIEGVEVAALRAIAPENLATNWQKSLEFLEVALTTWPAVLADRGKADAADLRNEQLRRQAETAPLRYGDRPVIAAGSTGSIPATADLLRAISRLPRGAVVLPGLDTGLAGDELKALQTPEASPHGHPQYGLLKLLGQFGVRPDAVTELRAGPEEPRTLMLRRALAPAEATAGWIGDRETLAPRLDEALAGLAILAAPNEDLEARAIAVAAREALAGGQSVGIISPDRNLARRIGAELKRFDIEVDDAAGTPLFQAPAGRLARLLLAVAAEKFGAVDLMALLRNRAVSLGIGRAEVARLADLVELGLLRGQRPAAGLAGLRQGLADNIERRSEHLPRRLTTEEGAAIDRLLERLGAATAPLCALLEQAEIDAARLAAALSQAMTAVTAGSAGEAPPPLPGREEFMSWAGALAGGGEAGPAFVPVTLEGVVAALMAGNEVRTTRPGRRDIAIWGRLEARLQQADLMILAGLNENLWPEAADPGPWLSRGMRLAAGFEPPERRQGQAAHDFEMAIGNNNVLLAFAARRGGAPALPSPLVQRLDAFVGKIHADRLYRRGARLVGLARRLDAVPAVLPARRPEPRPATAQRPRQLSITDIETLVRSPYDIYAKYVLRLRALDPLGVEPSGRERGTMVHDVFAKFVAEGHDFAAPDAAARLEAMAIAAFARLDAIGDRRDIWLRRFQRAAEQFLAFERGRDATILKRHAEIDGKWAMPNGFTLTGRADRIDLRRDGRLEIIDFKTGSVPSPAAMKEFLAPQLPLEAALAAAGGFAGIGRAETASLTYIKIGLGPDAFVLKDYARRDQQPLNEAIAEAERRLQGHVGALLLDDRLPMLPQILPDVGRRYRGTYDHLARTDEWALAEDEVDI